MWEVINALGWVGWIIGAICVVALIYQRDVNKEREKQQDAQKSKADEKDTA
jgi:hypothetical protein